MAEDKNKQLFLSLIYSFQMQAMMQLGKLTNPMTNKSEKELEGAQVTIDMLDMIKEKTKNNISDEELRFLTQVIADLKLNYVEERDKDLLSAKKEESKNNEGSRKENIEELSGKQEDQSEVAMKNEAKKAETKKGTDNKEKESSDTFTKESGMKKPEADKEGTGQSNTQDEGNI